MQLRERIILNSEMADLNSNFNSAVEASVLELDRLGMSRVIRNEKVKAISTLASGQDLLARLHSFSCQNASCSKPSFFFFLASRLCFGGFYVLTVILDACLGQGTLIDLLWFLNFWSS